MPHGHTTRVVAPAFAMTKLREGQLAQWLALPEMVVYRATQVSLTGSARLVCLELERNLVAHRHWCSRRREGGDILRVDGSSGGGGVFDGLLDRSGIGPAHGREERAAV